MQGVDRGLRIGKYLVAPKTTTVMGRWRLVHRAVGGWYTHGQLIVRTQGQLVVGTQGKLMVGTGEQEFMDSRCRWGRQAEHPPHTHTHTHLQALEHAPLARLYARAERGDVRRTVLPSG